VPGLKTNERPGTRAVLRYHRMSATKARQVLDLVRGHDVERAQEILQTCERGAAEVVGKVLASAVANAVQNDGMDAEDLYVSACFADEGPTLKRWRPRARGRATRIRKRTCHVTVIVSRMPGDRLERRREERAAAGAQRSRRVAESRRRADLAGRLGRRRAAHEREAAEREAAEAEPAEAEQALEDEALEDGVEDEALEDGALEDGDEAAEDEVVEDGEADGVSSEEETDDVTGTEPVEGEEGEQ
jgi:large subunit ribosomal protein L22